MNTKPSIKGAMIGTLVEDAKQLLERSGSRREELEARVSSDALVLIESKLEMAHWYPIALYEEISNLLWREEGDGRPEYLHQRGENLMKRLMEGGLYQQLQFLDRAEVSTRATTTRREVLRVCRLVGSITGAIRNFGEDKWEWDPENPDWLLHSVHDARHIPEAMRIVTEGAETFLIRLTRPDAPFVHSERPTLDHIVYTANYTGVFE